jgi:branched-chain amino acid aminotransferase
MIVFLNGKFVDAEDAKISVFDHGFLYGDGVYETLRTYNGKIWQTEKHIARLRKSAKLLSIKVSWSTVQIKKWLEILIKKNEFKESRIRLTVTRGENKFNFKTCVNPSILIVAEKLKLQPKRIYKKGVNVVTAKIERFLPAAKSISLLPLITGRSRINSRIYEAIFVTREGFVTEGTVTNIFIVKKSVLITPKDKILLGTTRGFVIKLAREASLRVRIMNFKVSELQGADEVFITNAPRGIVPVCKVDGKKIGNGKVGEITGMLMKIFSDKVKKYGREN